MVPSPGEAAVDVAAILLEGMDLVILGLAGAAVPPSRARAVVARARSKGACLVLGQGRGRVLTVQLDVAATGKSFQRRSARMEIGERDGKTSWRTVAPVNGSSEIDTLMRPAL